MSKKRDFCLSRNGGQTNFEYLKIPEGKNPQIYVIGKRPRIACDPKSVRLLDDGIVGTALIRKVEVEQTLDFKLPVSSSNDSVVLEVPYPYTRIVIKSNGKKGQVGVATILALQSDLGSEFLDLEILYVGQSLSGSAKYSIRDRIENHSTLQNIYSEAIKNFPGDEIWIGLFDFEMQIITSINGITEATATPEEDDAHVERFFSTAISDQHMVNFTEAALIRYFQPSYNKIYKNSFPDPAHSTYSSCYDLEVNMLVIGFSLDCIRCRVYSGAVSPAIEHEVKFNLYSTDERKSMFDFSDLQ
jgi:hypothetical protein